MLIWPQFGMRQYRDGDHREEASHFNSRIQNSFSIERLTTIILKSLLFRSDTTSNAHSAPTYGQNTDCDDEMVELDEETVKNTNFNTSFNRAKLLFERLASPDSEGGNGISFVVQFPFVIVNYHHCTPLIVLYF